MALQELIELVKLVEGVFRKKPVSLFFLEIMLYCFGNLRANIYIYIQVITCWKGLVIRSFMLADFEVPAT